MLIDSKKPSSFLGVFFSSVGPIGCPSFDMGVLTSCPTCSGLGVGAGALVAGIFATGVFVVLFRVFCNISDADPPFIVFDNKILIL